MLLSFDFLFVAHVMDAFLLTKNILGINKAFVEINKYFKKR